MGWLSSLALEWCDLAKSYNVLHVGTDIVSKACSHCKTQALVDLDGPHVEVHFPDDIPGDWLFPDQNCNILVSPE